MTNQNGKSNSGSLVSRRRGGASESLRGSGNLHKKERPSTGKLINAFYLEVDYVLDRVERATTHYQSLALERSASAEEIIFAYQQTVAVLHPSYHKVRATVPDEMLGRIDETFKKVSSAFFVLTNPDRRAEYDATLQPRPVDPPPVPESSPGLPTPVESTTVERPRSTKVDPRHGAARVDIRRDLEQPVFTRLRTEADDPDRRRCERYRLGIPVRVAGYDSEAGKWQEVGKTINVSRLGLALRLARPVRHGMVLHLLLPLPIKLRSHSFSDSSYSVYAIVRRVEAPVDGMRTVGLEFLGDRPPVDFLNRPGASFRTQPWKGVERRREPRREVAEFVVIEYLNDSQRVVLREVVTTENISRGGARLRVNNAPPFVDRVRLVSPSRRFRTLALVRNRYIAQDGFERFCLQFVDNTWPEDFSTS